MIRRYTALLACLLAASCGAADNRLPAGSNCDTADDCVSDLCLNAVCVDPAADIDHDGLATSVELANGLDPLHPDSDGDGIPDGTEFGADVENPIDFDDDALIDAIESALKDADLDCLPDQFDDVDAISPATSAQMVPIVCSSGGVCAEFTDLIYASCDRGDVLCDYSAIALWNQDEWWCDGLDNNCNGFTDEGFYSDGVAVGYPCAGIGECGPGVVECEPSGFGTRCSTNPGGSADASRDETCDRLDNDCDSATDDGLEWEGIPLGHACDGTGDCGVGLVECLPGGDAGCSTLQGGTKEQIVDEFCDGGDNDCDGLTDEAYSGNPSELCVFRGVCSQNPGSIGVACAQGVLVCDFSDVPGYTGTFEHLCDGADDDCDGQVDEETSFSIREAGLGVRFPGQTCGLGVCAGGVVRCADTGTYGECSTAELIADEMCNDLDDDCDGTVDNSMFKYWKSPPVALVDSEPQPRVASLMAVVEPGDGVGGPAMPAGVYVCGGARSVEGVVLSGYTGRCWRWDIDTRRFSPIQTGPIVQSGALVSDPARGRLLMVGVPAGSTAVGFWELVPGDAGWTAIGPTVPAREVLSAGIRTGGSNLYAIVRTDSGPAVVSLAPDALAFDSVAVDSIVEPGSFAAFDPGGGFYLWHACDSERNSYVEFVGLDGSSRLDPLNEPETCMSYGAARMIDSATMLVMSGIDREGHINGTYLFTGWGGVWLREQVAPAGTVGAVAWPGMAVSSSGVMAFSGVGPDGRGLRRILRFDPGLPGWSVDSVVSGPSPRAAGASFACQSTASAYFLGGWGDEPGGPLEVTDFWRLNLVTGLFAQIPSQDDLGAAIEAVAAVDDSEGNVYLFGGLDNVPGQTATPVDVFMRYVCGSGRWEKLPSGPPPRYGHSMVWAGDRLLLYGGLNNDGFLGDIWSWTASAGWIREGDYALRFGHSAFWDTAGGRMLVAGGRPGADVSAWYPATGEWRVIQEGTILDSVDGLAWFDPDSRSLLYLSGTSDEALILRFWEDSFESQPFSGLQTDLLSGFAVYDQFNRRGLLFGGVDPETGTVASIIQMIQACPM